MKKIISIIFLLVFLLSLGNYVIANAYTNPTFAVSTDTANAGDEVNITISVSNNPGIVSMKFSLSYDDSLTLKKLEYNSDFGGQTMQPESLQSPTTIIWLNPFENCSKNGTFATLTFEVSKDATEGKEANITLSYDSDDIYNLKETNVDFDIVNGKVIIQGSSLTGDEKVTGFSLDKTKVTIKSGEQQTIIPTISPNNATNKNVLWESDNSEIATVENGTVTGVSKGNALITATTEDGGFMATCEVTVNCSHKNKTRIDAEDSTCSEQGWDEYYICDDCGQTLLYDGTTEVTDRPFRPFGKHFGGTATCQEPAICDYCGNYYGDIGECNFNADVEKEEAIKTPGNCTTKAEYYYCCSVCGKCEYNDSHTFTSSKYCHSFTNYVYNNDATTEHDGTETSKCDYCSETHIRTAIGTQIADDTVDEKALSEAKQNAVTNLNEAKKNYKTNNAKKIIDEAVANILKSTTIDEVNSIKAKALSDADIANSLLDSVKINVASENAIDYRSIVTIKATATGVPEGYKLAIYLGSQKVAEGDNKSVSYEYGELKSDLNYSVKVIDANGKVQKDSSGKELSKDGGKITVNAGFFKKLIAFFKGLFKSLPKVEVKP